MHVTHLNLRDFRNYERLDLGLEPGTTLFYGPNAAGKTTILEALFYLATTRSPRAGADRELVRWDAEGDIGTPPFARLVCDVRRSDGKVRLEVIVQRRADDELAFWDRELALSGAYVLRERMQAVAELNSLIGPIFCRVTAGDQPLIATYQSSVAGLAGALDERAIEAAFLAHLERIRDDE